MQAITKKMFCDVAIIGGGVSGCSAAITTTRRGLKTIIFENRLKKTKQEVFIKGC